VLGDHAPPSKANPFILTPGRFHPEDSEHLAAPEFNSASPQVERAVPARLSKRAGTARSTRKEKRAGTARSTFQIHPRLFLLSQGRRDGGGTYRSIPAGCLPADRQECLSHMWDRHSCLFMPNS